MLCLSLFSISFIVFVLNFSPFFKETYAFEVSNHSLVINPQFDFDSTFPTINRNYFIHPFNDDIITQFTLNFLKYVSHSTILGDFYKIIVDDDNNNKCYYDGVFHFGELLGFKNPQATAQKFFDTISTIKKSPLLIAYIASYSAARLLHDMGFLTLNNVVELSEKYAKSLENSVITASGEEAMISGVEGEIEFFKLFNILDPNLGHILIDYATEAAINGQKLGF